MRAPPSPAAAVARRRALIIAGASVVGILIALAGVSTVYTEILWFREVDYSNVFWTGIWARILLGVVFGVSFAAFILLNLWIVKRITNPARLFTVSDQVLERYRATLQPYMNWIVLAGAIVFGLFAGSGASTQWRNWLLFANQQEFGTTDPVFGMDLGFFVFRLPFHEFLFTFAFSTLIVTTLIVAGGHYFMGGIRLQGSERVAPEVRAHLSVLLGLIVLLKAWGYRLDQFHLLYSDRGTVTGASYTDVNAQLPALKLLVVLSVVIAVFFLINARIKNWILPLAGIGLLALTSIVAGGIYPGIVQRFRVDPNEQQLEREFIQRNIDASRTAYDLADVEVRQFAAKDELTPAAIERNEDSIQNIRLWDPTVLRDQYVTLQRIRQYYEFLDVDVDRYEFGGTRRQIMLSAREVDTRGLPAEAQTWLNHHLVYTHGYGVVASRVDRVTAEGTPSFVIEEIPPQPVGEFPEVEQPRIYFGQQSFPPYVVGKTNQPELDFPLGDTFSENSYEGDGGIEMGGILRRAAFAWRFRDINLLISNAIRDDSKMIFRRNVVERVEQVAPYVQLDHDPYMAIVEGRMTWILDGYTTTDMIPYSQRIDFGAVSEGSVLGRGNYIRNAVKFTVDAEHGTVTGYIWDEDDPIIRAWAQVFPDSLRPRSEMPEAALAHVRYPEGIFRVQSNRYGPYHIQDPVNFYSQEDLWVVASDPTAGGVTPPPLPPYYLLQELPGEEGEAFVLVRPFTPLGRQNMTAYLVAHSDPEEYGRMTEYRFPKTDVIFGPEQIQGRINQDPVVSQQITLWDAQGSTVIRGNLLVVPIEESLLYVQPLYLLGQGSRLPELRRVVAVVGRTIRMGNTLDDTLTAIFEGRPSEIDEGGPSGASLAELIAEALEHDRLAQEALRNGDFAEYGRQSQLAREALEQAAEAAGAQPSPSPEPEPEAEGA